MMDTTEFSSTESGGGSGGEVVDPIYTTANHGVYVHIYHTLGQ